MPSLHLSDCCAEDWQAAQSRSLRLTTKTMKPLKDIQRYKNAGYNEYLVTVLVCCYKSGVAVKTDSNTQRYPEV